MPKTDSIESKSSDELKDMLMQTSLPDSGDEEEREEAEAVEAEETETEETNPDETGEKPETEKEVKPGKEETERLYKIKVEGKEEELSLPKVLEYAQKGRYLEKEKAKLNAERKRLAEESGNRPANVPQFDPSKAKDWFMKAAEEDPVGAIFNVIDFRDKMNKETERDERKKDKEFELGLADEHGEIWKQLKPMYQEFRDLGYSREESEAKAQADFWKGVASQALQTGTKQGSKKEKLKQMAEMPTGTKKTKSSEGQFPSEKDASKMTTAELRKILKYTKNTEW